MSNIPIDPGHVYNPNMPIIEAGSEITSAGFNIRFEQMMNNTETIRKFASTIKPVISVAPPENHGEGGHWWDISDGQADPVISGIAVSNAVVSETEPDCEPDLWFNT